MSSEAAPQVNNEMARLLVHVEGQTEEGFVNEILRPHLCTHHGYSSVNARLLGLEPGRGRRGGIRGWNTARRTILSHLKNDAHCLVTTMVDYYGMPQEGEKGWPGRAEADKVPFPKKAETVQEALRADIRKDFDSTRFVPYVMMHEFEGLLFSDCERFAEGIGRSDLANAFQLIRGRFNSPEEINDSPDTAPSKRVRVLVPEYQKPLDGMLAVEAISLDIIRAECSHFRQWLERLEKGAL